MTIRAFKAGICVLLLAGLLPLTGCMGLRQLNELAIVTAVGLDVGDKSDTVKLSVQIIRPADARGQTGAPSGGTGQPLYSIKAEGKSIFEAIRNLGRFSSRQVYWAHNFLIVMSEAYARQGITDMIDFFTRNHELRMSTWVAVTSAKPDELISTITGLEVVPGQAVDHLFQNNKIVGQALSSDLRNLEEAYLSRSTEPVLARLELADRGISNKKPEEHGSLKQVELAGTAVFSGEKMVGWLDPSETRGLMFFLESLEKGIEVLGCPNNKKNVSVEFKQAKLEVIPHVVDGNPQFAIRLKTNGDIVETDCGVDLENIRGEIEDGLQKKLQAELESVLQKAQRQYKSDFVKLGDVFRNQYPVEWKALGPNWNKTFADAEMNVQVKATIKSAVVKAAGARIQ